MGITEVLSQFVADMATHPLAPSLIERAKLLVLDLAGSAVRARAEAESTPALLEAVAALGFGSGSGRVFGDDTGYAPAGAALLNGALGHSLDFDDTHAPALMHPGATVIPAALAAAQMVAAPGMQALSGIVAGYEVALRLALALPAGAHYDRGFHPTATCGVFGAAAAAACIFGLAPGDVGSTLGIASSQAAGSLQFLENGAWTKRFQVGWASAAGLTAATLARAGFRGAALPLEGRYGFLRSFAPAPVMERAVQDLGAVFELMNTAVKPYPCCRWAHAGIDAALDLRVQCSIDPETVQAVTLGLSRAGLKLVGRPAEQKADPRSVVDAQFSAPFLIAVTLATGRMNWDSYRLIHHPAVRRLITCITCVHDSDVEDQLPANLSARLTVMAAGAALERMVTVPRGEPTRFPSPDDMRAKFTSLAMPILGSPRADELADAILGLDILPSVAALFQPGGAAAARCSP